MISRAQMWANRIADLLMEANDDGMMIEIEDVFSADRYDLTVYDIEAAKRPGERDFWVMVELP